MHIINDITQFIFLKGVPIKADIIFIPGGPYPELMETAAGLWHQGYAPLLLPSGKYSIDSGMFYGAQSKQDQYPGPYVTECEFYIDVALQCGIPRSSLLAEQESTYTMQNACFSRGITDQSKLEIQTALLCCAAHHSRRAYMYYQYAFPETDFHIIPVIVNGITRDNWHESENGINRVMGELMRCGSQFADLIPVLRQ